MRLFVAAAAALLALIPAAVMAADTVYVMRHLPRASDGSDPSLTPEGAAQAQQVAAMLGGANVKAVFATPTRRAMETGAPLAKKLGIPVTSYDPRDPDALVKAVAAIPGAVLVIGHSNTVGDLVAKFGGKKAVALTEQDYGTVFAIAEDSGAVTEMSVAAAR